MEGVLEEGRGGVRGGWRGCGGGVRKCVLDCVLERVGGVGGRARGREVEPGVKNGGGHT